MNVHSPCQRGMLALALVVVLLLAAAPSPRALGQTADSQEAIKKRVEPSIAYLQFWTAGDNSGAEVARYGTGFVVEAPNHTKWILTAAHSLRLVEPRVAGEQPRKIVMVRYRFPRQPNFATCESAILDAGHDLVALRPQAADVEGVPPLALGPASIPERQLLYAVGSPSALPVDIFEGRCSTSEITVERIAQLQKRRLTDFQPWERKLTFLQHQIPVAGGFSGCPIVTDRAEVVGLQSSTLPDAAFVGFAVHRNHIHGFQWDQPAIQMGNLRLDRFRAGGILKQTAAEPVAYHVEPATPKLLPDSGVTIELGGVPVEAPFLHHGYVERDAKTVIDKYVQDKEFYTVEVGGALRLLRLQQLLDRTDLARISNPVLGLELLVPKGYQYGVQATEKPKGLLATFSPPADRPIPEIYHWPFSIWVTVEPQLFAHAKRGFLALERTGKFPLNEAEKKNPELHIRFCDRYRKAMVADRVDQRFATEDLGLRIIESDGTSTGRKEAPAFTQRTAGEGDWLRSNYFSTSSPVCHLVRLGSRPPLIVVAHFQFHRPDLEAFLDLKGEPDPTHVEYAIMASSVSLK